MNDRVCAHPAHEGQPDWKRTYPPGWEGHHEHKVLANHRPVPATSPPDHALPTVGLEVSR